MIPFSVTCTGARIASVDIASVSDTLARRRKKSLDVVERGGTRETGTRKWNSIRSYAMTPVFNCPNPRASFLNVIIFFPCICCTPRQGDFRKNEQMN